METIRIIIDVLYRLMEEEKKKHIEDFLERDFNLDDQNSKENFPKPVALTGLIEGFLTTELVHCAFDDKKSNRLKIYDYIMQNTVFSFRYIRKSFMNDLIKSQKLRATGFYLEEMNKEQGKQITERVRFCFEADAMIEDFTQQQPSEQSCFNYYSFIVTNKYIRIYHKGKLRKFVKQMSENNDVNSKDFSYEAMRENKILLHEIEVQKDII